MTVRGDRSGSAAGVGTGTDRARRWRLLFIASLVVQVAVVYAPSAPGAGELHGIDKVVHVAVFALPAASGLMAGLRPSWLLCLLALHAPVSELLQHVALPHRDGDVGDVLADLTGVVAGAAGVHVWRRRRI